MCVGIINIGILKDAGILDERIPIEFKREQGSWVGTISGLDGEYYLIVDTISTLNQDQDSLTEYILRVDFIDKQPLQNIMLTQYIPEDGGKISVEYSRNRKGNVKLNWSPLY